MTHSSGSSNLLEWLKELRKTVSLLDYQIIKSIVQEQPDGRDGSQMEEMLKASVGWGRELHALSGHSILSVLAPVYLMEAL